MCSICEWVDVPYFEADWSAKRITPLADKHEGLRRIIGEILSVLRVTKYLRPIKEFS
jgi:hypothetical protein